MPENHKAVERRLITAHELAEQLGLSVETIWRYTRDKKIPYIEIGRRQYRYDPERVLASLASRGAKKESNGACAEASGEYAAQRIYTYSDYLALPYEETYHYEVLSGTLVREPAPTPQHQIVSHRLHCLLEEFFWQEDPKGKILCAPIDLTLSETDVIQPDLVYVPGDSQIIEATRLNGIPKLIVEIISLSSRTRDRVIKLRIYQKAGVPHYWIVDPETKIIEAYGLKDGEYTLRSCAAEDEILTHPDFPELKIELAVLWD